MSDPAPSPHPSCRVPGAQPLETLVVLNLRPGFFCLGTVWWSLCQLQVNVFGNINCRKRGKPILFLGCLLKTPPIDNFSKEKEKYIWLWANTHFLYLLVERNDKSDRSCFMEIVNACPLSIVPSPWGQMCLGTGCVFRF